MNHQHHTNCQDTIQQLNAYLDDELDPQLCAQLEAHLESCTDCHIVYNTLKKTIQLCQSDGEEVALPADVRQRLLISLGLGEVDDTE
jgi:RNA polymerase sigma-70 factor (ECF subfamily)